MEKPNRDLEDLEEPGSEDPVATRYERFKDHTAVSKSVSFSEDALSKSISFSIEGEPSVYNPSIPFPNSTMNECPDNSDMQSISSVLTADGISDKTSFQINCLVVFLSDMARGIFFPCMWELVQKVGGDQVLLGYVVASFSFGRMLVLPLFGRWSTIHGYKWTLMMSVAILSFGALLFSFVLTVRTAWFLLLANVVIGIGSGTLGVTVAYTAEVTPKRKRTGYMAYVSAVQYAGTTATPFFGSLFIVLFQHAEGEDDERGLPQINEFTAPALFMFFTSLFALYLLKYHFNDIDRTMQRTSKNIHMLGNNDDYSSQSMCCGLMTIYTASMLACMVLNAATKGPMSCFETLGIDFAETRFDLHRSVAGSIVATMGLLGAIILVVARLSFNRVSDATLIYGGILVFIIGIGMNLFLDDERPEENAPWRYALSMFLSYSIGYPICHNALVGLFSKIIGRRPQGTLQGFFSASGSVARVAFPVMAGYITTYSGIETLFIVLLACLTIASLFAFACRKTFKMVSNL